jgi:hypothetical protein
VWFIFNFLSARTATAALVAQQNNFFQKKKNPWPKKRDACSSRDTWPRAASDYVCDTPIYGFNRPTSIAPTSRSQNGCCAAVV